MSDDEDRGVGEALEQIVVAGVAITTRAIATATPGLDLTFPQWRVLVVLAPDGDGMRISEVARRIGVTLPATGRQVRRLERRGLVSVRPDERDRRAARASLTDDGRAVLEAIRALRRSEIARIAEPFEQRRRLRAELARLAGAFDGTG
jgi:DNA-binding MarR family transcriptional regulator